MTVSLAKAYRASADPHRVDEVTVRRRAASLSRVAGTTVVEFGRFRAGGEGLYASVEVIGYRPDAYAPARAYSTHTLVLPSEADGLREPYLIVGHYDLTLAEACADLSAR